MARMPAHALAGAKAAVFQGIDMPLAQALENEGRIFKKLVSLRKQRRWAKKRSKQGAAAMTAPFQSPAEKAGNRLTMFLNLDPAQPYLGHHKSAARRFLAM
jgi:hypothetical protein